jgi:hypothetical protein
MELELLLAETIAPKNKAKLKKGYFRFLNETILSVQKFCLILPNSPTWLLVERERERESNYFSYLKLFEYKHNKVKIKKQE